MNYNLMEIRTALNTTTNTTGVLGSTAGGAEVQKRIQELPVDAFNKMTDLAKMLPRKNIDQAAYIWNSTTETALGGGLSNSSFTFYAEGQAGSPVPTTRVQLFALARSYRTDYEVSGLMIAAGMGDQLSEEARYAAESHAVGEERSIICGTATGAYGFAASFLGLLQLMNSNEDLSDTTTIYGLARANGREFMDVNVTFAGATATDALDLADLDTALRESNVRGAKGHRRIWFCSEARVDEISQRLQSQQRFVSTSNTVEFDGGFRALAYKNIPIIGSRFMDRNGITWNGSSFTATSTDNAMYLLDLDHIFMVHVAGVNAVHTPVTGGGDSTSTLQRADVRGGYYKSYGVLVMDRFDTQSIIVNLAAPA